jgi:hypothetical protein
MVVRTGQREGSHTAYIMNEMVRGRGGCPAMAMILIKGLVQSPGEDWLDGG